MSGYDELARDLGRFRASLTSFNEQLAAGLAEVQRNHEQVDPVWNDRFRRTYDQHHDALVEPVMAYASRQADDFERFLTQQIRALRRYLDG